MVSILLTNMKDRFSFFILCMVTLSSFSSTTNASSPLYDVMNYGAVGDGKTDDSQAFLKAWNEACNVQQQRATLNVPARTFLLNPIEFSGPCVPTSIEFQVAGKIIASTNKSLFDNNHWILFSYVKGLTLTGSGTIDGQGAGSWQDRTGVAALKFYTCPDLVLQGLTHINPQKAHIILTKCDGANINSITITAPEDAPNTDGIDIASSNHVQVQNSKIGTGDDCIAISARCSFINITGVTCGPGHGISIGSLGDPGSGDFDTVSEVHVRSCNFTGINTTGVRIKTWQGGQGEVKKITYEDIMFDNVRNPIVIDQFYCPHNVCKNNTGTSAVAISDVSYTGIIGTASGDEVMSLNCGTESSCNNIVLDDVHLKTSDPTKTAFVRCVNFNGRASNVEPSLDQCLNS
ncbi:putative polygalacturonase [Vitis vinifera]|uniref:Putative polygalacturonase n=1 Tax=Vitis vinifera TaxID=29760 RepID=A0A438H7P2_VITVI|nr:putative polygalacturonase [Vitis vinifera]